MEAQAELSPKVLDGLVSFRDVSSASYGDLMQIICSNPDIAAAKPERLCQIDPRTGDKVAYSASRNLRPHDTQPRVESYARAESCPICRGETTSVIDVASLSEGFTFINENLYPILYPGEGEGPLDSVDSAVLAPLGKEVAGAHFVQWASTQHDRDIHNMPAEDVKVILERLAALEARLLHSEDSGMPTAPSGNGHDHYGYVGVIKNFGRLVGGSISHGHMQVIHTNILPRAIADDADFLRRTGRSFSAFLLHENPEELLVKDYPHVSAVVPYFMKRPLDAIIMVRDGSRNSLHDLSGGELGSLAAALSDLTGAVTRLMPRMGLELAYNLVFHTGPIGGLYVEVLPLTQVLGGYEKIGLYLCEGLPSHFARLLHDEMKE